MRKNGIDKLAFLVVLGATVLVLLAAMGTGPAYSDDSRTAPGEIHSLSAGATPLAQDAPETTSETTAAEPRDEATAVEPDGYEWSGSRPADERYLWSHRTN